MAAIVAEATTKTTAVRMPAKRSGTASGSSTRCRICRSVMPMPRAASTTSPSISLTATYAFVRIGGTASTTSEMSTTVNPTGRKTTQIAITASVGSARPTFEMLIATNE